MIGRNTRVTGKTDRLTSYSATEKSLEALVAASSRMSPGCERNADKTPSWRASGSLILAR